MSTETPPEFGNTETPPEPPAPEATVEPAQKDDDSLDAVCNGLRTVIRDIAMTVAELHNGVQEVSYYDGEEPRNPLEDLEREMHANITLAYRHLEDARMRLGKVIQAAEGGTSIYDTPPAEKNQPPAPARRAVPKATMPEMSDAEIEQQAAAEAATPFSMADHTKGRRVSKRKR